MTHRHRHRQRYFILVVQKSDQFVVPAFVPPQNIVNHIILGGLLGRMLAVELNQPSTGGILLLQVRK